jgi:hypothetical protein
MITIEELKVFYDAAREGDEARFAALHERHRAADEDRRRRAWEAEATAGSERSVRRARGTFA